MAKVVNMHEAKSSLSKLVESVENGEEVVLARNGTPVAKIVPFREHAPRRLGQWKGRVRISEDFDDPLPDELLRHFEARDPT